MKHPGPLLKGCARGAVFLLVVAVPVGALVGCGGAGTSDRAMVDPGKADAERKAAEAAARQNYTPDKMKPKGARR